MKLEDQVVSLELAKKMRELGFEQDSYWFWQGYLHSENRVELAPKDKLYKYYDICSAYTVAELGEMLPAGFISRKRIGATKDTLWSCYDDKPVNYHKIELAKQIDYTVLADTEAHARAKMLIYLKENGHLK